MSRLVLRCSESSRKEGEKRPKIGTVLTSVRKVHGVGDGVISVDAQRNQNIGRAVGYADLENDWIISGLIAICGPIRVVFKWM